MKRYLLLRDNMETGPFSEDEMQQQNLKASDLVWVEGESNSWRYPYEIKAFENTVSRPVAEDAEHNTAGEAPREIITSKGIFVALPHQYHTAPPAVEIPVEEEPVSLETHYEKPLSEIKEMYVAHLQTKKNPFPKTFSKPHSLWLVVLLAGLVLGAFTIKKMVDSFDEHKLNSETLAAAIPATDLPVGERDDPSYQNALSTEIIPIDTVTAKPVIVKEKKVNLKKLVKVVANDYKVGVFGGINNLEVTVYNNSEQLLEKVLVEVDFLKPNGDVVKTETVSALAVLPQGSKVIKVPANKRGVKVQYRIKSIKAKPEKVAMLQT